MKPAKNVIPITRDNSPMTTNLPEPMTPMEADLRGLPWMELDGIRLFRSTFWLTKSAEVRCAGLELWWESMQQTPAGSLPDDDVMLAKLAGFGRDLSQWMSHRTDVLHGWILCSDGRLYHPVIAAIVIKAWAERIKFRAYQETERERKRAYRDSLKNKGDEKQQDKGNNVPNLSRGTSAGNPPEIRSKTGTGTGTGTGNNIFINTEANSETSDPKSTGKKPPSAKKQKTTLPPDFDISPQVQAWAESNGHTQLPARLENFRLAAERNGYQYADWDAAFKTAIRDDWAKLSLQAPADSASSQTRGGIHSGFDKIDYTRGIGPNGEF